ncbi:MAG TPA: metalloregulator ArsR/SmtB family transcription factor [Gemmatimonadales bacterium]|nr:metalloregulator ArsR/SmtB family transcription factor [Gemmatimonadales bacterium]
MVTHRAAPAALADAAGERVFRAVADPTRRAILDRLRAKPLPVHDIAASFPVSRAAVSKHLRVLRAARLVQERRRGRERIYQLDPRPLVAVEAWLELHRASLRRTLARLKAHVESASPPRENDP